MNYFPEPYPHKKVIGKFALYGALIGLVLSGFLSLSLGLFLKTFGLIYVGLENNEIAFTMLMTTLLGTLIFCIHSSITGGLLAYGEQYITRRFDYVIVGFLGFIVSLVLILMTLSSSIIAIIMSVVAIPSCIFIASKVLPKGDDDSCQTY